MPTDNEKQNLVLPDPNAEVLAQPLVGDADDSGLQDVRVAVQDLLDLLGVDVLAAPDHHLLDATHDLAITVGV